MGEFSPWRLTGSYFEVCNCEAVCPCRRQGGRRGGHSTYATCDFAFSWVIAEGHAAKVDLAGLNVAMLGSFCQDEVGMPWRCILYLDERASAHQQAALAKIFLGREGGTTALNFANNITEVYSVRSATVLLDHTPKKQRIEAGTWLTVRGGEHIELEESLTCAIPGHNQPGTEVVADLYRVKDGPFDWELHGKCGFTCKFDYASEG